jgi:DNA-binding CsgD family transcriptional regulator
VTLYGRAPECRALDGLLSAARSGRTGTLVLYGEPGIGKSALLDYVAEAAAGWLVARATGVEQEMELPFAGLHQLCAGLLGYLPRLPVPQRDAMNTAFGLRGGGSPDRFLIGLALVGLLAEAAAERPVACLVDDVQWLDQVSVQALAFAARRLHADRTALVFAARSSQHELSGHPVLILAGLDLSAAGQVLSSAIRGRLDPQVRDQLVAETHGNPLALLELPRGLTPGDLAGGFGLPAAVPLASRIEHAFLTRFQALPLAAQRLLLAAAAEPAGDLTLLWRAARLLGIPASAAAAAEESELVEFGIRARFRHPLVRSAIYSAASPASRREAHSALAEATDRDADPDRAAWHSAQATLEPEEAVAAELVRSASRAQERGGVAAAAAFLQRAAELTPDAGTRSVRALAAAQAKFDAAAPEAALDLLAAADMGPLDDLRRAHVERLRARIAFSRSRGAAAAELLFSAARRLGPLDARLARDTYLEGLGASIFAGRLGGARLLNEGAVAARGAPSAPAPARGVDLLLDGLVIRFTDGYAASVAPLRRALRAFWEEPDRGAEDARWRWLWLVCPVTPEPLAPELWDDEAWHELAARAVNLARDAGALSVLPIALTYQACAYVHAGEFAAASTLIEEAGELSQVSGNAPLRYVWLALLAWRGREAEAIGMIEADMRDARARGEGRALGLAHYASAVLHNGLGRYETALAAARSACEFDDLGFFGWALTELIEAAARDGQPETAAAALDLLTERTRASGTSWARGMEARSRALVSEGPDADAAYREAVELLGRSRMTVHLARARLVYGEWLRRESRRTDARVQLRAAFGMFDRMGAAGFAQRTRRELAAAGESAPGRTAATPGSLTTQEAQVAAMARDGLTNPEIASRLFLSARTVEWHLGNVYAKLGISSRRELRAALGADANYPPSR